MLRALELHVVLPQLGLTLLEMAGEGQDAVMTICPLGNEKEQRRLSVRDFEVAYGRQIIALIEQMQKDLLPENSVHLTNEQCAALVRRGLKTEVVSASRSAEGPIKALRRSLDNDKAILERKDVATAQKVVRAEVLPGKSDPLQVERLQEMLRQYCTIHIGSQLPALDHEPWTGLWPVQRVGQAYLAQRLFDDSLVDTTANVAVQITNDKFPVESRAPGMAAGLLDIYAFEIPLQGDWRLLVFIAGMRETRGWMKKKLAKGYDLPGVWSLVEVAEQNVQRVETHLAELRRRAETGEPAAELEVLEELEEATDTTPRHEFFIGIKSDGCVFGSMELTHKECLIPHFISVYGLQEVSKYAREAAEFVNLYSAHRGINRFAALIKALDLLRDRPEVRARGVSIPVPAGLIEWVDSTPKPDNRALQAAVKDSGDPDLRQALKWSMAVNKTISVLDHGMPPYPFVRECLKRLSTSADMLVVSDTPNIPAAGEWAKYDMAQFVKAIRGEEDGNKDATLAAGAQYPEGRRLMIGDTFGDYKAAANNGCLFFPIIAGVEEESWQRLFEEGIERFLNGTFEGVYQQTLMNEFQERLPEMPVWGAGLRVG